MITGLKGGHSGLDINEGRANAIKLLARTLNELSAFGYILSSLSGGSLRNAIPRESEAVILIRKNQSSKAERSIKEFEKHLKNEFRMSDGSLKVLFRKSESDPEKVFMPAFQNKIINLLLALPHGVIAMSQDIPGLVETSTNLATVTTGSGKLTISTSQRSSVESAKEYIASSVKSAFFLADGKVTETDGYPGWKPDMDSAILKTSVGVYKELFSKEPEIKAIHAGLECGILGSKNKGLDNEGVIRSLCPYRFS
jgi:dipeptidase D